MLELLALPGLSSVDLAAPGVLHLSVAKEELQRRVVIFGWDVSELGPDLAVPQVEFERRDGRLKLLVQKSGNGFAIEMTHVEERIRRGYRNGPQYSYRGGDGVLLRFTKGADGSWIPALRGTTTLPTIEDALLLAAQVIVSNPPERRLEAGVEPRQIC